MYDRVITWMFLLSKCVNVGVEVSEYVIIYVSVLKCVLMCMLRYVSEYVIGLVYVLIYEYVFVSENGVLVGINRGEYFVIVCECIYVCE